jgi:hypothetical protein
MLAQALRGLPACCQAGELRSVSLAVSQSHSGQALVLGCLLISAGQARQHGSAYDTSASPLQKQGTELHVLCLLTRAPM